LQFVLYFCSIEGSQKHIHGKRETERREERGERREEMISIYYTFIYIYIERERERVERGAR
jgi:hypothetical protein